MPKKDGTVHHPARRRHAVAALARQPELHHAARLDLARARPRAPRHLRLRSRSVDATIPTSLRAAALALRDLLDELGLPSWVKTSGSKGFHIVVPLDGKAASARSRDSRTRSARVLVARDPKRPHAGVQQGRSRRPHPRRHRPQRLQRDVRRRLRRSRARPGAPVSAPCTWEEIERGTGRAADVHAADDGRRAIAAVGDLWADMRKHHYSLRTKSKRIRAEATTRRSS